MPRITYQDFDVLFDRTANAGEYSAKVFGESGSAGITFTLADIFAPTAASDNQPPAAVDDDRADRNITFASSVNNKENYYFTRRHAPALAEAKQLGGNLFAKIFKDSLRTAFEVRREMLRDRKTFLRVRLHLTDVPELATLPWEFLYNAENNHFYAQLPGTPVVRYLDIAAPIDELTVKGALRMLVVISSPTGAQALNVEGEWQKLQAARSPLVAKNLITIERLENATTDALQDKLQDNVDSPFHIFHFIGHGVFDNATGEGYLLFEDETGAGTLVSGETLGVILNGQELRLAVINSCEGAISAQQNAYAGVAQALCRNALIPAVLAMQFDITDNAAIRFAEKFYSALVKDFPVEAALAESRKAILIMPSEVEWATPVLYMRADDGRMRVGADTDTVIDNTQSPPVIVNPANENPAGENLPNENPLAAVPPALAEHYNAVIQSLRDGQFVPFVGLDANLFGRASDPDDWEIARGLPGSAELASYLSRAFNYPLKDLPDLARIAQYSIAANRLGDLYDKITEIFINNAPDPPPALHLAIAELAAKVTPKAKQEGSTFLRTKDSLRSRFIVVSMSYDNLFEAAFKSEVGDFHVISYTARGTQRGKFLHQRFINSQPDGAADYISSPNDYNGLSDGNPVILKLPGIVESIEPRFAITEDDYFDYLTNRELTSLLPAVVTGKLKASNHLFLGYSPRSWNMRALLYRIWEEQRRTYRESWAVLSEAHTIDETFWSACNVTIVRSGLSEYIAGLNAAARAA